MMTIREFKEILAISIQLQTSGISDNAMIPYLVGTYGVGKTSVVKQVAQELDLIPIFVILTGFDPALWTIPVLTKGEDGSEFYEIRPVLQVIDEGKLLVFDELDKAKPFQINPLLSLFVGKEFSGYQVKSPIVTMGNSDSILYSIPALNSRLLPLEFPVPSPSEVIAYLSQKFHQHLTKLNPFAQSLISVFFEYMRRFGVHDLTDAPRYTPRTCESLVAYLIQLNPSSMSSVTMEIVLRHLGESRFNEFIALFEDSNFPDPHSNPNEIVEFLQKPVSSSHFAFTRLYTIHLATCENPHPLNPIQFVAILPSSLIDTFITTLQSVKSPRVSQIIAELSSNQQTAKLISSYTTMSIK